MENAKAINTISLCEEFNKFTFILGKYAIRSNNEIFNYNLTQDYIDCISISKTDRNQIISQVNSIINNIRKNNLFFSKTLLSMLDAELVQCAESYQPTVFHIVSVDEIGLNFQQRKAYPNPKYDFKKNWLDRKISIDDIRQLLSFANIASKQANNKCRYCGSNFKGLFSKVCSNPNCGRPKDY